MSGSARGNAIARVIDLRDPPRALRTADTRISLLGGFELTVGDNSVEIPVSAQRVVAFLALHDRPMMRGYVAGCLWPDTTEEHAAANLRSALWRLRGSRPHVIQLTAGHLHRPPSASVDLHESVALAKQLIQTSPNASLPVADQRPLTRDLLPDWFDDWLTVERERFRQLRVRALEALCIRLAADGCFAEAVDAGLEAVAAEPLRESAHCVLIRANLAEGDPAAAVHQYEVFRKLLYEELGLEPSPEMKALLPVIGR